MKYENTNKEIKGIRITTGDDGISLRSSERRPHTIIRYIPVTEKTKHYIIEQKYELKWEWILVQ